MSNVFNILLTFDDIHILGTFGDIGELTTNPNYSKIHKNCQNYWDQNCLLIPKCNREEYSNIWFADPLRELLDNDEAVEKAEAVVRNKQNQNPQLKAKAVKSWFSGPGIFQQQQRDRQPDSRDPGWPWCSPLWVFSLGVAGHYVGHHVGRRDGYFAILPWVVTTICAINCQFFKKSQFSSDIPLYLNWIFILWSIQYKLNHKI